jgi:UDP-N-acetyl-2-amino-2-deoxyglucuronate dehydrogenase
MHTNYALIGAAGYIAPRHMRAIKETGGDLKAAYDLNDSVGVIDSHFPTSSFFTEFECFDEHLYNLSRKSEGVDYVAICSPNHLHRAHMSYALRNGTNAICEKPLVLDPKELDLLENLEKETGVSANTILQLRLHPAIIALKNQIAKAPKDKIYEVDLGYFTSRGEWYHNSWKGVLDKSGGIATNIGIHFFDMLYFLFGELKRNVVHHRAPDSAAGYLEFDRARVRWVLSINFDHLPERTPPGQSTYRSITVESKEIEFSGGFTDLHTTSYQAVLDGQGFSLNDARPSVEIARDIRNAKVEPSIGEQHPDLRRILAAH